MAISLPDEIQMKTMETIKQFFAESLEEEIGDLKARLVYDFCLQRIGPAIYNQAISDAQAYFFLRVEDLEGVCHETEQGD